MTQVLCETDYFIELFKREKDHLPGQHTRWLSAARATALDSFVRQGLPHALLEDWRFTPLKALTDTKFEFAHKPKNFTGFGGRALCPVTFHRIVLHNGRFLPERSLLSGLPAGVTVLNMAQALRDDPAPLKNILMRDLDAEGLSLASLAAALFSDGVVVKVSKHARLDKPLQILFASDDSAGEAPQMAQMRVLIILEDGAQAEIIEESVGCGRLPFWSNLLTQIHLGEGSALTHYHLQRESAQGVQTSAALIDMTRAARYESHAFNFGGALVRNDLRVRLQGPDTVCVLNGLSLVRTGEVVDHHTLVEHAARGGTTRELYKAVLDGNGHFIFNGLASVRPGAQKTDAQIYNKNLLLSDDALVDTKPDFKIDANDVQCKHGATIGRLSADALFYLRSRGVGAEDARRLLVSAFASEMTERISLVPLREALEGLIHIGIDGEAWDD